MANLRDMFNAYGAQNDPAMARQSNANAYADLPNPRRAQEIVQVARERLAASGGKASQLPAMIERVTQEFASQDQPGGDYQQPNNMEAYIDRVLQMSGMSGGSSAPTPTPRPDDTLSAPVGEVERGGPIPDAAANPANGDATVADDNTMMAEFASLAAIGGAAYAAYKLYQKYGKTVTPDGRSLTDMPNATDGGADAKTSRLDPAQIEAEERRMIPHMPDTAQIEGEDTPRLPPPTAIDESIASTLDDGEFDRRFQADIEGRSGVNTQVGPNRFANDPEVAAFQEIERLAASGDVRGAVNYARQNGIELDDNMMRMLAEGSNIVKSLRDRIGDVAGPALRQAVR